MNNIIEDLIAIRDTPDFDIKMDAMKKEMDADPVFRDKVERQFKEALQKSGDRIAQLEREVDLLIARRHNTPPTESLF